MDCNEIVHQFSNIFSMSSLLPNSEIKQELLDTLEKLIRHSSTEAQLLSETLQSYRISSLTRSSVKEEVLEVSEEQLPPTPGAGLQDSVPPLLRCSSPVKEIPKAVSSILDNPISQQFTHTDRSEKNLSHNPEDTIRAARVLLEINSKLHEQLRNLRTPEKEDQLSLVQMADVVEPFAKRPRIDLGPHFTDNNSADSSTQMVLVPIPADKIRELMMNGGTIPPMSLLSAFPFSQLSNEPAQFNSTANRYQFPTIPPPIPSSSSTTNPAPVLSTSASSSSPPLLSPTMSSSILRFCERKARTDAVDVFHYLPADARSSPFPATKPGAYRNILNDITINKVKMPKLPKTSKHFQN